MRGLRAMGYGYGPKRKPKKRGEEKLMKAHGKRQSKRHMREMRRHMKQGKGFGQAHRAAMRSVGR